MAEVILDGTKTNSAARKRGKFLASEDLIIVREVSALRAHVATYGVRQTFRNVAARVIQNPHMTQKVTWKSVQDRYKRLQDDFDSDDIRNSGLSGVAGGEMGELYQALPQMREERDSFVDKKQSARNEKAKKEEEKELMGKRVVEMALLRKAQRSSDEESAVDVQEGNEEQSVGSARKKQRRGTVERVDLTSGLALFAEKLKDAHLARVKLDEEALQFEKHKHDVEISEREKDRAERCMEREQANKLELEKFKLMMEMLRDKQK